VALGGVGGEPAPAAAEIEHAHAGTQADLLAHQRELGFLRLVERGGTGRPQRAGVEHAAIEHGLVEIVADVVVVLAVAERAADRL
jgi:hypothetical protein